MSGDVFGWHYTGPGEWRAEWNGDYFWVCGSPDGTWQWSVNGTDPRGGFRSDGEAMTAARTWMTTDWAAVRACLYGRDAVATERAGDAAVVDELNEILARGFGGA